MRAVSKGMIQAFVQAHSDLMENVGIALLFVVAITLVATPFFVDPALQENFVHHSK